jgi:hypothetical protein
LPFSFPFDATILIFDCFMVEIVKRHDQCYL